MHLPLLQEDAPEPRCPRAALVTKTLLALCALTCIGGWCALQPTGAPTQHLSLRTAGASDTIQSTLALGTATSLAGVDQACTDIVPAGQAQWYDSDGEKWNCSWYSKGEHCSKCGDGYKNFGHTANEACCACSGGAKAWWASVSGPCAVHNGCIRSPGFPGRYGNYQSCRIHVSSNTVAISASTFAVRNGGDLVVNGNEYSGIEGPNLVVPTTTITWTSDAAGVDAGWELCPKTEVWWASVSGPCGVYRGCVRSPGYPGYYSESTSCQITSGRSMVPISARTFRTEHDEDYLSINGERYSGRQGPYNVVPTTTITWEPDDSDQDLGWELCPATEVWWASVSGPCLAYHGCIRSHGYPDSVYPSGQSCRITVGSNGVVLSASTFATEANFDYLFVNGLGYSGTHGPHSVVPTTTITWTSDGDTVNRGWELCPAAEVWWASVAGPCVVHRDCICSPDYPDFYSHGQSCNITVGSGMIPISAVWFATPNDDDSLWINGVQYSGDVGPQLVVPTTTITWASDFDAGGSGWKLCPATEVSWGTVSGPCTVHDDCIRSPGYPDHYGNAQSCTITVDRGGVPVSASTFATENGFDLLWINGKEYSGHRGPHLIVPTTIITWTSNRNNVNSGWELCPAPEVWWASVTGHCWLYHDCVRSPGYPNDYSDEQSCSITMSTVPMPISATTFATEKGHDALRINGVDYSGNHGPHLVVPTTTITWTSDHSNVNPGWELCPPTEVSSCMHDVVDPNKAETCLQKAIAPMLQANSDLKYKFRNSQRSQASLQNEVRSADDESRQLKHELDVTKASLQNEVRSAIDESRQLKHKLNVTTVSLKNEVRSANDESRQLKHKLNVTTVSLKNEKDKLDVTKASLQNEIRSANGWMVAFFGCIVLIFLVRNKCVMLGASASVEPSGVTLGHCDDNNAEPHTAYDIVIKASSLNEFVMTKNWKVLIRAESAINMAQREQYRIVAVTGVFDKGKTFLVNELFDISLPSGKLHTTEGLSMWWCPEKRFLVIDSAGCQAPVRVCDADSSESLVGAQVTESFLFELVSRLAHHLFFVVSDFTWFEQKYVEMLRQKYISAGRSNELVVVHNFKDTQSIDEANCLFDRQLKSCYDGVQHINELCFVSDREPCVHHVGLCRAFSPAAIHYNKKNIGYLRNRMETCNVLGSRGRLGELVAEQCNSILPKFVLLEPQPLTEEDSQLTVVYEEQPDGAQTRASLSLQIPTSCSIGLKKQGVISPLGEIIIHDCSFDPKVAVFDVGSRRTVRVECPGVPSKDIGIEETKAGVQVTIIKTKPVSHTSVQAVEPICQTHGQWKKRFSFDSEPYEFKGESLKHEDGVLYLHWEKESRVRKFRIGDTISEEEEHQSSVPARSSPQPDRPPNPRQPGGAWRAEDASLEAADSVVDDKTSEVSSFMMLHDVGSQEAACPAEKPKCYLPNYGFKSPDGNVLLTQNVKVGDKVLCSDGREACVASIQKFEYNKRSPYDLVSLSTPQGSFEVSAGHRVALPGGAELRADELKDGDEVMVGGRVQKLINVLPKKMRTDLYSVRFEPDCSVEAFPVAQFGLQTKGEASDASQDVGADAGDTAMGWELLQIVEIGHITAEELDRAQPSHYED